MGPQHPDWNCVLFGAVTVEEDTDSCTICLLFMAFQSHVHQTISLLDYLSWFFFPAVVCAVLCGSAREWPTCTCSPRPCRAAGEALSISLCTLLCRLAGQGSNTASSLFWGTAGAELLESIPEDHPPRAVGNSRFSCHRGSGTGSAVISASYPSHWGAKAWQNGCGILGVQ